MKLVFNSALLMALSLGLFATPARAATINGQNYVPLANWASANGLSTFWLRRGDEVALTNRTMRLVFDKDSHTAQINGVNVALSFPLAVDKGAPLIAQFDLDNTIRPLLFPTSYIAPAKITTICLDPGHGGKDPGNRVGGLFARNEKAYTLPLALELSNQLKHAGFRVILTRSSDTFVDLPRRPAIANAAKADLFVSLHFNASPSDPKSVAGPETYCITPVGAASSNAQGEGADHSATTANRVEKKSLLFAYQIQKSLVQNLGMNDRSVRRARFAVLRDAQMPAILIEGGYMTNPTEGKKIYDAAWRRQMASAIVKGILAYQKITAPAVLPSTPVNKVPTTTPTSGQRTGNPSSLGVTPSRRSG
jgi:N-acetylmuramoyl-L-alanine amidase